MDSFHLVEGKVARVGTVRGETYVDFGADWREDFTITIDGQARCRPGAGQPAGRRVQVRGWLSSHNGPSFAVTHPEQIELLP